MQHSYDDADRAVREGTLLALRHAKAENKARLRGLCDDAIDTLCALAGEDEDLALLAGSAQRLVSAAWRISRTIDDINVELREIDR